MKDCRPYVLIVLALLMAACSNQDLYEAIQENRVNECRNMTYKQEQACLNSVNQKSYEEYNRERGVETDTSTETDDGLSFSHESNYKS